MTDQPPPNAPDPSAELSPQRLVAEAAGLVRFFSRLPLPRLGPLDDPMAPFPFATALRMLPLAALVIAAPAALVLAVLAGTDLSSWTVAALALVVLIVVCGGLHEDGLADVADAFAGGSTPARRLEIMKDSRIGAFGGLGLIAQFVLRAALLAELLDRHDALAGLLVLAVAPLARVGGAGLLWLLPPARPDGLGRAAGRPDGTALAIALGVALGLFAVLAVPLVGVGPALVAPALAALVLAGLARLATQKIAGVTGDVVGAGIVLAEIALLIGLSV